MCSDYEMTAQAKEVAQHFGLTAPAPLANIGEFRPTDQALIISANDDGQAQARLMGWGLSVEWDKKPIINARMETVTQKKTFQPLLQSRCLVPATGYFEWRKSGTAKLKNRISLEGASIFAFAGLTDGEKFTIITCPPAPAIAHIHDRMPVILAHDAQGPWIDRARSFDDVSDYLMPFEEFPLKAAEESLAPSRQPDLFG